MTIMRVLAPAKLNFFLHITGKRHDGYHLLQSLVAFADVGDEVHIAPADALTLQVQGPFAAALGGNSDDNLVLRAARMLQQRAGIDTGAALTLVKNLPVGAGLGGGSSDAAATLKALAQFWNIADAKLLVDIGASLGSDIAVCLAGKTAWVEGVGERVTPVVVKGRLWGVIVNPAVPLLTADVYKKFVPPFSAPCSVIANIDSVDALINELEGRHNDLETPAMQLMPVIGEVLSALRATGGYRLARMSGSGASCFALYENEQAARTAAAQVLRQHAGWWCVPASFML